MTRALVPHARKLVAVAVLAAAALGMVSPSAAESAAPARVSGIRFKPAQTFIERYCAGCHTAAGKDPGQRRGYQVLQIDSYEQWQRWQKVIRGTVDLEHLDGPRMPPADWRPQPSPRERDRLLEWMKRGSPNTPRGR